LREGLPFRENAGMKKILLILLGALLLSGLTACESGASGAVYSAPNANATRIR
jgi:hypothetical protein